MGVVDPIMVFKIDNEILRNKAVLATFFLAIFAFALSSYSIRQRIIVEPLSKKDRNFITNRIVTSEALRSRIGPVKKVEFYGGIYNEKHAAFSYAVKLITENDRIDAELRLKRPEHKITEMELIHLSLNVDEAFLIALFSTYESRPM